MLVTDDGVAHNGVIIGVVTDKIRMGIIQSDKLIIISNGTVQGNGINGFGQIAYIV